MILISNDDGYHAPGIRQLVDFVQDLGDVLVCAPESARSGYSCAFSAVEYLRLKPRHNMPATTVFSCTGTPVDCVKIALDQLCTERRPTLILSGINHGDNSSVNNHYSGTMGVAKEGCMKNIPRWHSPVVITTRMPTWSLCVRMSAVSWAMCCAMVFPRESVSTLTFRQPRSSMV